MFGIGFTELILIAIVLLVVIGPDKLPDIIKDISRLLGQVKKGTEDIKRSVRAEAADLTRWAEIDNDPKSERMRDVEEPTDYTTSSPEPPRSGGDEEDSDALQTAAWNPAPSKFQAPDEPGDKPPSTPKKKPIKTAATKGSSKKAAAPEGRGGASS